MNISTRKSVNWTKWFRQVHRWLAVVFTVSIVVTTVALLQDEPLIWVSYVPLLPLAFLLVTGLYMFAQPYVSAALRHQAACRPTGGVERRPLT
jgi:hypothetical protein